MPVKYRRCCGIDVHKKSVTVCILPPIGRHDVEVRRRNFPTFTNDLKQLQYCDHETLDDGHGRIDERSYYLTRVPRDFAPAKDWPWVKAIGYSVRITRHSDGTESDEVRYYLSSRYLSGKRFGEAVRGHWGIESMHWVLDVNFREDDSRTRERTLGNNSGRLRPQVVC